MDINFNRDSLFEALGHIQGIIEKRGALPILSNVLIEAQKKKIKLTSTDLDLILIEEIEDVEVVEEGSTTVSATVLYDIIRKLPSNSQIKFKLASNKLQVHSALSKFNLLCLSPKDFPLSDEDFSSNGVEIDTQKLLKLINKTKFSISNDETRHYLSGIYLHKTNVNENFFLTAVATDSHRLAVSSIRLDNDINFEPVILPKKTIFQLSTLLSVTQKKVKILNNKSKIKFQLENIVLISKVIDGKFPNYKQVIPLNNKKKLEVNIKDFINSLDRAISVSSDRKEGVKMEIMENDLILSVNNPNSGDSNERIKAKFDSENMKISFNSKYLMDVASQIEGDRILFNLSDTGSPVMVKDFSDNDSLFVIMPMKI